MATASCFVWLPHVPRNHTASFNVELVPRNTQVDDKLCRNGRRWTNDCVRLLHAHKFLHGFRRENTRALTRKLHKLYKNSSLTCCVVFFEHLPSARAMVQESNAKRREDRRKRRITLPPTPPSADSDADGLAKTSAAMGL